MGVLRVVLAALVLGATLAGSAASASNGASSAFGDYIVVLKDGVTSPAQIAAEHGRAFGFTPRFVYRHALRGYAATLSEAAVAAIQRESRVLGVSQDGEVRMAAAPECADVTLTQCQRLSFAVDRIDGELSSTRSGDGKGAVNINVAVLDDGGPVPHPDLNVVGSTSCVNGAGRPGAPGNPAGWHGTLVGGFIGALDNNFGRVGVAPGARLWAVRVLHEDGVGSMSEIVCGIDWVTGTRTDSDPTNDVAIANMSLGGPLGQGIPTGSCADAPNHATHRSICGAVAAGVTIVAAAGNESRDIQNIWPATLSEVLTATAMADFDGKPGGLQPPSAGCVESAGENADDSAAWFSNFATLPEDRTHAVAAPGVCIGSTFPGGVYAVSSGTSFASPLVAGTAALCIASGPCSGLTPQQIIQKILGDAAAYNTARKNVGYGFSGDPVRPISGKYYGYLIRAGLY